MPWCGARGGFRREADLSAGSLVRSPVVASRLCVWLVRPKAAGIPDALRRCAPRFPGRVPRGNRESRGAAPEGPLAVSRRVDSGVPRGVRAEGTTGTVR